MSAIYRPARRLALAAAVVASLAPLAHADTAYFSFQGSFSTSSGAFEDFNITLPSANNPLTLRTYAASGGTNAAGQLIAAGGIDSILTLFNAANTQIGSDDDASPAVPAGTHDSLLSPTGTNAGGTNNSLLPNQPAGSYRLRLTNFSSSIGDGHWSTDIVNANTGTNTVLTAATGTSSSITSLAFGSTGTANATFNLTSGSLTLASTLTANSGAILNLNGGTLNANGNITVNGTGQIIQSAGSFNWGLAKTMTISGSGHVDILSGFTYALPASSVVNLSGAGSRLKVANGSASTLFVGSGSQVNVSSSASLTPDFLFVGTSGNGTVSLSGSSVLTAAGTAAGNTSVIGSAGNTGTLTLAASTASFTNPLLVGDSGSSFTSGIVNVQSGSSLTTGNVSVGTNTTSILANGTVNVTGAFSTWSQAGSSTLTVGGPSGGTGTVNVTNSGFYSNGSLAPITVNKTGTINVATGGTAGAFTAGTGTTLNGGSLFVDASATFFYPGSTFAIQNGGTANIAALLSSPSSAVTFNTTVDGPTSSLTLSTALENSFGFNGNSSSLSFSSGATGTITGTIGLADQSSISGSTGILNVFSGAHVSSTAAGVNLSIGTGIVAGQAGTLYVSGPNSSFSQNPASPSTITIGAVAGGAAGLLAVDTAATFTTGTGSTLINPTGAISVSSATYNANGSLSVGGSLIMNGGTFNSTSTINNNGSISLTAATLDAKYLSLNNNSGFTSIGSNVTIGSFGINVGGIGTLPNAIISGGTLSTPALIILYTGTFNIIDGAHATFFNIENGAGSVDSSEVATLNITGPGTLVNTTALTLSDYASGTGIVNVANGASLVVGTPSINTGIPAQIGSGSISTYAGPSPVAVLNVFNGGSAALASLPTLGNINFTSGSLGFQNPLNIGFGATSPFGPTLTLFPNMSLATGGTTTISPGATLTLNGGSFSTPSLVNNGVFNFLAGTLAFNSAGPGLTIGAGGPLGASVNLAANKTLLSVPAATIAPTGILFLNGGTLTATGGLTNNGEIQLLDPTSQLTGSTLTNNKLIDGNGRISNNLTNTAAGELRATGPTQRLTFTGSTNSNAGKINMVNGGTIEFTGPLTNSATGVITGRGALITPALANAGQIQISAGLTDVYGPVTTSAGGKIIVTGAATATFYNALAMNAGSEFRVTAGSTAVFFSPVTGVGQFTGTGTKFFEAGASAPGFLATGGATVVDVPASLTVDYFRESSLSISGLAFTRPGSPASVVNTLSIDPAASLDLADNKLILDYTGPSQANAVRTYLLNHNLLSSTANADPLHRLAIGYADNTFLGVTTWGGLTVDPTSILTKLTYLGDANLDGKIDADDYALLDRGYAKHLDTWSFGDFNYDGQVTSADFLLIDRVFTQQTGVLSPSLLAQRESQFGPDYVTALIASVPEPTSLLACGFAIPTLLRRRPAKRFTH